jgi:CubicO group peptidase (beta-lactamase class C family)
VSELQSPAAADLRAAGFDVARAARIGAAMQTLVAERRLPGMALRVSRRDRVLDWQVGTTGAGPATPFEASTLLHFFSMTKALTSALLFTFFEEGRWGFADPVTRFLPELAALKVHATGAAPQRPITMRDLLLHQAGFAYGMDRNHPHEVERLYACEPAMDFTRPIGALLERVARLPLAQEPGIGFRYSVAHDLQGLIAERLGGAPLDRLMHERLLEPLRMRDASFAVAPAQRVRFAPIFEHDALACAVLARPSHPLLWSVTPAPALLSGGGGLVGTLEDEHRFLRMVASAGVLDGQRVLAPATVRLMTAAAADASATEPGAAHTPGWFTRVDNPVPTGSCAGAGTLFTGGAGGNWGWIDAANDLIVVGMQSVLNWSPTVTPPMWAFDPLIYQAIDG